MRLIHLVNKLKELLGDFYKPVVTVSEIIAIIILSILLVKLGSFVIKKIFSKQKTFKGFSDKKRLDTMGTLLASVFRYGVYIVAVVVILSDVFQLKSILAAAGVGGIALGFGAQSLIKDIISGFFIIMEDQYAVGDMITIESMTGTVEEMELRVTKLRNFNGDLHIIPNGEIKRVTNHTRGNKAVIVDIPIAYSVDIGKAAEAAERVCDMVSKEFDTIVEPPSVLGITELGKESMNLRIMAKTLPNEQWTVERRIRRLVKEEFGREGLEFFEKNKIVMNNGPAKGDGVSG